LKNEFDSGEEVKNNQRINNQKDDTPEEPKHDKQKGGNHESKIIKEKHQN
jgi:hypothetical protein